MSGPDRAGRHWGSEGEQAAELMDNAQNVAYARVPRHRPITEESNLQWFTGCPYTHIAGRHQGTEVREGLERLARLSIPRDLTYSRANQDSPGTRACAAYTTAPHEDVTT